MPAAAPQGQAPEVLAVEPQKIESRVVQIAAARHQIAEALTPLGIERDDLAVEDRLGAAELGTHPIGQLVKPGQEVAGLRTEVGCLAAQVKDATEPVVLGLEEI